MRLFLTIILVGLLGGVGIGWWPQEERDAADMEEALRLKAEAALGIRRMLRSHPDFDFQNIVVGRVLEGGHVDFRGQMQRQGRAEAVYGLAAVHCGDDLSARECWTLSYLETNGRLVDLAEPGADKDTAQLLAGDIQPDIAQASGDGLLINAATQPEVPPTGESLAMSDLEPELQDPQPDATHLVARAVINTRSGPGTQNPVLTKLSEGARLSLIERQGSWGNFVILDGQAGGQEVWAALSLLEEAVQ